MLCLPLVFLIGGLLIGVLGDTGGVAVLSEAGRALFICGILFLVVILATRRDRGGPIGL